MAGIAKFCQKTMGHLQEVHAIRDFWVPQGNNEMQRT